MSGSIVGDRCNTVSGAVRALFPAITKPTQSSLAPMSYLIGSQILIEHLDKNEDLLQSLQLGAGDGLDLALTTLRALFKDCGTADDCRVALDNFAYRLGAVEMDRYQKSIIQKVLGH